MYKKGDHKYEKNYRPVFLLIVFSKIYERLIYYPILKEFLENDLTSSKQSVIKSGHFCIDQIIEKTHETVKGLDGLEVRGVVLDNSEVFGKV